MPPLLLANVKNLLTLLAMREYDEIERLCPSSMVKAEHLKIAIEEYGRTVAVPPPEFSKHVKGSKINNTDGKLWWIVASLWTEEEGISDLSLKLTADISVYPHSIEIDNLHVL